MVVCPGGYGTRLSDVSAVLHGDDAEMVLLIAPHEEGLVLVVEDSTALQNID